jgi:hypothetical protein
MSKDPIYRVSEQSKRASAHLAAKRKQATPKRPVQGGKGLSLLSWLFGKNSKGKR